MLEFKKEYFQTETNRHLYPTTLDLSKAEVYGCKDREAYMYKIPNNRYTSNAGNIDFSLYPNGIWSDYTGIKIVERLPFFQPSINFNKLGDITPSNLNKLKEEIRKHIVDLETAITESVNFIDSGVPGQNNLPYLPEGCVWFRDPIIKDVIALPISELYGKFNQMIDELRKILLKLLDKDYNDTLLKFLENVKKELERQLSILAGAGSAFKPKQVANVEILKNVNAKVDEVYEVLGYYSFDDGANHKRKIAREDDGSGVQLTNGLWANIVHDGEVNVSWFGAKGDGVTDDLIYINKALSLCNNLEKLKIKFNKCNYYVTSVLTPITFNGISLEIDGNECEIIDGRTNVGAQDGLFQFKQSKNVSIYNFKFTGYNHENLSRALQPCIRFTSSENVNIKKIKGENLYCNLINLDPRKEEGGCYNFKIKDITAKYITGFTVIFSSFDHSLTPSEVGNGIVDNVYSFGNGKLYETDPDFKGEWSTGIDFGEALNSLKNVKFINCHSENCAESGFHSESSVVINNVSFENCSSINNGQKPNAMYGYGWFCPEGIVIKNCISSKNKGGPISFSKGVPTSEVDIWDKEIGRIYYRSDYPIVAELHNKEKMLFGDLKQSYGMRYIEAKDTNYDRGILNIKKDLLGRYINREGLATNLIKLDSSLTYFKLSGYVSASESTEGVINYTPVFGRSNGELIPLISGKPSSIFSYNNITPIDLFEKEVYFDIAVGIDTSTFSENPDCTAFKFTVFKNLKLRNLSIKKCEFELNKNLINELHWKNIYYGAYPAEILESYSKSYFKKETILDETWFYRNKAYDKVLSQGMRSSEFLYSNKLAKLEVKYRVKKEGDISGITPRISIIGSSNKVEIKQVATKNINATDTEISHVEVFQLPSDVDLIAVSIVESGTYSNNEARILYAIDSVKFILPDTNQIQQLNSIYHLEKMKQENVYDDYIAYNDEKFAYDKQQKKLEEQRQLAYQEALKENPKLTYEEFMSVQPMTLNLIEEPQPSLALKQFMEKYL